MKSRPKILSKAAFVDRLAEALKVPRQTALRVTDKFIDVLETALIEGLGVGFKGSFSVAPKVRKGRPYKRPTGDRQVRVVPDRTKLTLKVSDLLLSRLQPPPGS